MRDVVRRQWLITDWESHEMSRSCRLSRALLPVEAILAVHQERFENAPVSIHPVVTAL